MTSTLKRAARNKIWLQFCNADHYKRFINRFACNIYIDIPTQLHNNDLLSIGLTEILVKGETETISQFRLQVYYFKP